MEYSTGFTSNACVVGSVVIQKGNVDILVPPLSIFKVFLSEACVRSSIPIVSECLVVVCCRVIPRTAAISLIIWDMNTDPVSEMIVVGKKASLVIVFIMTLAIVFASGLEVRYAKKYLENTSKAVTMFS